MLLLTEIKTSRAKKALSCMHATSRNYCCEPLMHTPYIRESNVLCGIYTEKCHVNSNQFFICFWSGIVILMTVSRNIWFFDGRLKDFWKVLKGL